MPRHVEVKQNQEQATSVSVLVTALGSESITIRRQARERLVAMGTAALDPLLKALCEPNDLMRWEAVKALSSMHEPAAAPALVTALGDERSGTRWVAAEGLIALGRDGLEPLLRALTKPSNAFWLGEGARHVLHELAKRPSCRAVVLPVVEALSDFEPGVALPQAARAALIALKSNQPQQVF
jgi:HEAT repeat protein